MITIFTLEVCPNCEILKQTLDSNNVKYKKLDAMSAEGITEMRVNGCFAIEMPVVMIGDGDRFLEHADLFLNGEILPLALQTMKDSE